MYDSKHQFTAKIPYPEKSFLLRLPTSEEITVYLNAYSKKNRKDDDRTPDVELFDKIRVGDRAAEGDADEYACSYLVNNILSQDVTACEKEGDVYTVTLHTPFGDTTHSLGHQR